MNKTILIILSTITLAVASPDIGDPAPNFTLPSSTGKNISLEDFKGKIVVLEWVNHGSPYCRRQYVWEKMQKAQRAAKSHEDARIFYYKLIWINRIQWRI